MEANSDVDSDDIVQKAQAQMCACALSEIIRDAACIIPESRNMEVHQGAKIRETYIIR
jgi:hypothetical protein